MYYFFNFIFIKYSHNHRQFILVNNSYNSDQKPYFQKFFSSVSLPRCTTTLCVCVCVCVCARARMCACAFCVCVLCALNLENMYTLGNV